LKQGSYFINEVYTNYFIYEEKDRSDFREIYNHWKSISDKLINIGGSSINFPKILAKGIFSLETGAVKIISPNHPFDCYNFIKNIGSNILIGINLSDKVLLKSSMVNNELYFFDFYRNGEFDGIYSVYLMPNEIISIVLNGIESKKVNIYKDIIKVYNLQPLKTQYI
jgi:hypothetical protein